MKRLLPASWREARLGFLVETQVPQRDKPDPLTGPIPWVRIEDFDGQDIRASKSGQGVTPEQVRAMNLRVFEPGTVMCSCSCSMGATAIVREPLVSNQTFIGLKPGKELEPRFLFYLMGAMREELQANATGAIQQYLSRDDFRSLRIPLPPLNQQRRIADFLDSETARIDSLSALRERQVQLAFTRLESLAKQETGRILIRGAKEPSGEWMTYPLRRAISGIKTGATPPGSEPEPWTEGTHPDTIPWYGPSSFQGIMHLGTPVKHLPSAAVKERVVPFFAKGSVLIIGIGATAGKVAYLDHDASANQQITALTPERGVSGKFLAWQLWAATQELRELAPYTTLPIINNDFLKSFPIAMPPTDFQQAVVQKLDCVAERVGALHAAAAQASKLTQERRQSLITAAVTGQFDVSTASGRNVTEGVTA
ncbi:restriction endonuclease subunit S [Streptomyces glaucus]|uniref:Restriction endonuclease subunit S n=1 Tax=Streptomyces glaucus TaxID=284029 RepID=A0ABN3J8V1_9ACTN